MMLLILLPCSTPSRTLLNDLQSLNTALWEAQGNLVALWSLHAFCVVSQYTLPEPGRSSTGVLDS